MSRPASRRVRGFGVADGALRRGQRVRVRFANQLGEDAIVHWHGLDVPDSAEGHPRLEAYDTFGNAAQERALKVILSNPA